MTLGFSTHIAGWPTLFTNKIVKGLWHSHSKLMNDWALNSEAPPEGLFNYLSVYEQEKILPKIHTIRIDLKDRWKIGNKIHFVIDNRTKDRFQFAPVVLVNNIQNIMIVWSRTKKEELNGAVSVHVNKEEIGSCVFIDDILIESNGFSNLKQLAENDGFDSVKGFFNWFNNDFEGKIIHWTDFKYY